MEISIKNAILRKSHLKFARVFSTHAAHIYGNCVITYYKIFISHITFI